MMLHMQLSASSRAVVLLFVLAMAGCLVGCTGQATSAAAPSGVPNTPESTEQTSEGQYDCVANEAGDAWDCREIGQ